MDVHRINKRISAIEESVTSLSDMIVSGVNSKVLSSVGGSDSSFAQLVARVEKLETVVERLYVLEEKLSAVTINVLPVLEERLAALEAKPEPVVPTVDLSSVEERLSALEAKPEPDVVEQVALLEERVTALEHEDDDE